MSYFRLSQVHIQLVDLPAASLASRLLDPSLSIVQVLCADFALFDAVYAKSMKLMHGKSTRSTRSRDSIASLLFNYRSLGSKYVDSYKYTREPSNIYKDCPNTTVLT